MTDLKIKIFTIRGLSSRKPDINLEQYLKILNRRKFRVESISLLRYDRCGSSFETASRIYIFSYNVHW